MNNELQLAEPEASVESGATTGALAGGECRVWPLAIALVFVRSLLPPLLSHLRGESYLPWPDTQVVPAIYFLRGRLQSDLVTSSLAGSPYIRGAKVLSRLLPDDRVLFLTAYGTLAALCNGACLVASTACVVLFTKLVVRSHVGSEIRGTESWLALAPLLLALLLVLPRNPICELLLGQPIAGWGYPFNTSLNPSGMSFLFATLALLIQLWLEGRTTCLGVRTKPKIWFYVASYLCFAGSAFLHPVCPLYVVIVGIAVPLVLRLQGSPARRWWLLVLGLLGLWGAVTLGTLRSFPQASIDGSELVRIYVRERHPHHFLPSSYFAGTRTVATLAMNAMLLVSAVFLAARVTKARGVALLAASALVVATTVNGVQYVAVEVAQLSPMVTLGISRMSGCFNFLYTSAMLASLATVMVVTRLKWPSRASSLQRTAAWAGVALRPRSQNLAGLVCAVVLTVTVVTGLRAAQTSPALLLSEASRAHGISKTAEYVFDEASARTFPRVRELGSLNVFADDYFPFRNRDIVEWSQRRQSKRALLSCLELGRPDDCALPTLRDNPVYVVTSTRAATSSPEFSVRVRGQDYFVRRLNPTLYSSRNVSINVACAHSSGANNVSRDRKVSTRVDDQAGMPLHERKVDVAMCGDQEHCIHGLEEGRSERH